MKNLVNEGEEIIAPLACANGDLEIGVADEGLRELQKLIGTKIWYRIGDSEEWTEGTLLGVRGCCFAAIRVGAGPVFLLALTPLTQISDGSE